MSGLRLVVGLGNPGREYARTRHNAGFLVVDAFAERSNAPSAWKVKDGAAQLLDRTHGVLLVKPQSYMNLSGEPTQRIAAWHKVAPRDVLVVVDDLDLPFGKLRLRERGGSGGHNGLKSLIAHFGEDFPRLRVGIGRDSSGQAIGHVLGTFTPEETSALPAVIGAAVEGIRLWLEQAPVTAVNYVNAWVPNG